MTDDRKLPDLADIDWDQALSEWEENTFVPEVAKERNSGAEKLAPAAGSAPTPPAPPPTSAPTPPQSHDPSAPSRGFYNVPSLEGSNSGVSLHELVSDEEDEANQTVIARIPRELLRGAGKAEESPKSQRGGLGQLFGKTDTKKPDSEGVDVQVDLASSAHMPAASESYDPESSFAEDEDPSVVTSARGVDLGNLGPASTRGGERRTSSIPAARPSTTRPPAAGRKASEEDSPFNPSEPPTAPADALSEIANAPPSSQGPSSEGLLTSAPSEGAILRAEQTRGPSLLMPEARKYDPNEETSVLSKSDLKASIARAEQEKEAKALLRLGEADDDGDDAESAAGVDAMLAMNALDLGGGGDGSGDVEPLSTDGDDDPTHMRRRGAELGGATTRWESERPATAWLDGAKVDAFRAKAAFFEAEARAAEDPIVRARGLLTASELRAMVGDREGAAELANEARETAPELPLTHRQVRALLPTDATPDDRVDALDLESRAAASAPARVHAELAAADVLRLDGRFDDAAHHWQIALDTDAHDVRAAVARAASSLARSEHAMALALPAVAETRALVAGVDVALRVRGVVSSDEQLVGVTRGVVPNESIQKARAAVSRGDVALAAEAVAELQTIPELAAGATWLASAFAATTGASRPRSADLLQSLVESGDAAATRILAARGLELGDADRVRAAVATTALSPADRAVVSLLAGLDVAEADVVGASKAGGALQALAAALSAGHRGEGTTEAARRAAERVAGARATQAAVHLARLLAWGGSAADIEAAARTLEIEGSREGHLVAVEMAIRARASADVSATLAGWPFNGAPEDAEGTAWERAMAAAVVAEHAGDTAGARDAYREARDADGRDIAALRALATLDPNVDLSLELNTLADTLDDGPRGALARLEAIARSEGVDDATRRELLERAQRAEPSLPIAAFLAESIARREGDTAEVLRWVRERHEASADVVERALDAVREARLVRAENPELARERLEEAARARPDDAALRELVDRFAPTTPESRGAWRERRAEKTDGPTRAALLTHAAYDFERAGFTDATWRTANAAAETSVLAAILRDRAELVSGRVSDVAESLVLTASESAASPERTVAQQRLAEFDRVGRNDAASALLWHRAILADDPGSLHSLRHVENALISDARAAELEPVFASVARALSASDAVETIAHAELATRFRMRGVDGDWDGTREMAELGASCADATLSALRLRNAHARARGDDAGYLASTLELIERAVRPQEVAVLCLRAGEAAARLGDLVQARALLERAKTIDAGDVVTWGMLADVCQRDGDLRGAAEACESLARTSAVAEHQLLAWYDAGRIWLDEVGDVERAIVALEHASVLDVTFQDTFARLAALYGDRGLASELAHLLDRRIATITDPGERVDMEVERAKALVQVGYLEAAKSALSTALETRPDHPTALTAYGELCARQQDWEGAEQAWVRLARLASTPDEQREIYGRLGALYADHTVNLSRAELAFKEVLKRAPEDIPTRERLVDIYRRQNDVGRAVEAQTELVQRAGDPSVRRARMLELAEIHEQTGHDVRRAEQTLDQARKEFPTDVSILRATADFYMRHNQRPATQILLDRAVGDARRAFATGRFSVPLFEIVAAVYDLRNKKDAASVAEATLAAYEGRDVELRGADTKAFDPRLDDLLAPELISAPFRSLLMKTGDALDAAFPADLRPLSPTPIASSSLPYAASFAQLVAGLAPAAGLGNVQILVTSRLGRVCLAAASNPPTLLVGEALLSSGGERVDAVRAFLAARALKLVQAKVAPLVRAQAADLVVLVAAWLKAFNPTWTPTGVNAGALAEVGRRVQSALPKNLDPDVGLMSLEVIGTVGAQIADVGGSALTWANRAALLAVGNPSAALDGIAWTSGLDGAPVGARERTMWIAQTPEAKDLLTFGVSESYIEARVAAGLVPVNAPPPLRRRDSRA